MVVRLRQKLFYLIFLICLPLWLSMLILMMCWDIAQNFRGQINAGYSQIMDREGIQ